MTILLLIIYIICTLVAISVVGYDIGYRIRKIENKRKNSWPVTFKLTEDGCLVYSVNGKLWTEILKYSEDNGIPILDYMKFNNYNSDYKNFTTTLGTMQNCHLWNTREFNKYKEGLKRYLENNK